MLKVRTDKTVDYKLFWMGTKCDLYLQQRTWITAVWG